MTNAASADVIATPVSTGTRGLDELLLGGLTPNRMYLVEGNPGTGENNPCLDVLVERARCVPAADLSATVRTSSWSLAERGAGAGSTAWRWVDVGDDHAAHRSCRNREVHDGGAIRGDRVTGTNGAIFLFDERASTFISRTDALGMKLG